MPSKKPDPALRAAEMTRELRVTIVDGGEIALSLTEASKVLGVSRNHFHDSLKNPQSYLSGLQPKFFDLNGGMGTKPCWRILLADLRAFMASCPKMGRAS